MKINIFFLFFFSIILSIQTLKNPQNSFNILYITYKLNDSIKKGSSIVINSYNSYRPFFTIISLILTAFVSKKFIYDIFIKKKKIKDLAIQYLKEINNKNNLQIYLLLMVLGKLYMKDKKDEE